MELELRLEVLTKLLIYGILEQKNYYSIIKLTIIL